MARPVAFGREQNPAADDRERTENERRTQRLTEEDQRDRDCDEWRSANRDRRPRRPDLPDGEREEQLRPARRKQASQQERPGVMDVVAERSRDQRDRERGNDRRKRGPARIDEIAQSQPDRDSHRSEQRCGGKREEDHG